MLTDSKKIDTKKKKEVNKTEIIFDYFQNKTVVDIVSALQKSEFTPGNLIRVYRDKKIKNAKKLNEIAYSYDEAGDEEKAFEIYEYAAMLNDKYAMGNVAYYYFHGSLPCLKDVDKALMWCEKAIKAGDVERNILKAEILRDIGQFQDAITCLSNIKEPVCKREEVEKARKLTDELQKEEKRYLGLKQLFEEYNFTEAATTLEGNTFDKGYKYQNGSTIAHILILIILADILRELKSGEKFKTFVNQDEQGWDFKLLPEVKNLLVRLINQKLLRIIDNQSYSPLELFEKHKQDLIIRMPQVKALKERNNLRYQLEMLNQIQQEVVSVLDKAKVLTYGKKYVPDFSLKFSSKKPGKECSIPNCLNDESVSNDELELTLHQRLALSRAYLAKKYLSTKNLVVANIGFVVSEGNWNNGTHTRRFITFVLEDMQNLLIASKSKDGTHSEDELIWFLNRNVANVVEQLKQQCQGQDTTKVYVVILDINSTAFVCDECAIKIRSLQKGYQPNDFLYNLQQALHDKGFILPDRSLFDLKKQDFRPRNFDTFDSNRPVLKLVVRASGFGNFGGGLGVNVENGKHVPPTDLDPDYERNVKSHSLGIIFHLPNREHQLIETLKEYSDDVYIKSLDTTIRKGFFNLYRQTGFANSGVGTIKSQARDESESGVLRMDKIESVQMLKKVLKTKS
jgi:hypothetical protein